MGVSINQSIKGVLVTSVIVQALMLLRASGTQDIQHHGFVQQSMVVVMGTDVSGATDCGMLLVLCRIPWKLKQWQLRRPGQAQGC